MAHINFTNWHRRFDEEGSNIFGRNRQGRDRHGRDSEGFDINDRDRDGYTRNGRHRYEDDRESGDEDEFGNEVGRDGFLRDGYNTWGYDREGYDRYDRDEDGYDRNGYDEYGYNRAELNRNGRNRWGDFVGNRYAYRFDIYGDYIGDDGDYESDENDESESDESDENDESEIDESDSDESDSDEERENEILSINNRSGRLVLDFNTNRGENYALTQIPDCNADLQLPKSVAWEVHEIFNKNKKIFMSLYFSLGDKSFEPFTINSVDLFIEIQRLLNAKLYSIVNTLPDYDIKISILIKTFRKLLSNLYDWLVKRREDWDSRNYCDQNRALFLEAICDYTKIPPMPLPVIKIWDLFLRYIINLCSLNDELFTNIILDYSFSNVVEAYRDVDDPRNSLQRLNTLLDVQGDSCARGWIERIILCVNDYIIKQELLKGNASKLFMGTTMNNLVEVLIKNFKVEEEKKKLGIEKKELDFKEVNLFTYINEFKLSEENNRFVGDLETKKKILKNKLYCFIYERLNKIYNIKDTFELRDNIEKYVDVSIYEEDFNDEEGKYLKKYLKYKNKYLNLKKMS